ncbi:glucan exo-1,3-beta-glucosidase [Coniosporium apollinis]|uniref:Glucan exo-1,3-beta-glucosidase n=1 Tax=Coniosporium apollinis TaxID=61459 RepID=A0ABQ9P181_9PEZI|nr:glucan exo-1,3-beta-glucosidase [Coniosporium apollinis]
MLLKQAALTLLTSTLVLAAPHSKRKVAFNWGSEKIRGVNIGGWLVLEPWITPSLFQPRAVSDGEIIDEYTLCEKLGPEAALKVLRPHWDSWATWHDFKKIADAGFNMVRIPIGYWAYETFGAPYVQGAAPYMDAAIDWARSLGLMVMIDLHGAPGSQNGYDNSGQRLANPGWQQGDTVAQTLEVIQKIADKYAQPWYQDVVMGIQLLNEPNAWKLNASAIRDFNREGFNNVRKVSDTTVVFHDAFLPPNTYNGFLTPNNDNAHNVAIDHHEYQVFSLEQIAWEPWQHRQHVCNNIYSYWGADKWTFVGEWTAAMTDCAGWLNGHGIGARYDGTYPESTYIGSCATINDISTWTQEFKDDTRGYIEAQLDAFSIVTQGYVFWNFKTEQSAEWDLFRLLDAGVFPQPLSDRKFAPVCSNLV